MTTAASSPGILSHLFTPIPTAPEPRSKDVYDHVAEYADTAQGAWDVFRFGNHVASFLELHLLPSNPLNGLVGKVKEVMNGAGIALSIPQIFSDLNAMRHSFTHLFTVQDLPYSDPHRTSKIAQAAKKGFLDTMVFTNSLTQAALFLENAKVFVFEVVHLKIIDGIYNLTSGILDGAELVGECFKLKQYHAPESQPRNSTEAAKLEEKKTLAWLTIAKDVASVALAAIPLGVIAFGVTSGTMAACSTAILTLSAFWLTMKLSSYFYNKIVVEGTAEPQIV